jgi:2-desacetyl-2-hydroxyethyl bacteriochlorophyllide A dehydrogenase
MSTATTPRRLAFTEKQKVILESFDPGSPAKGQVRLRTEVSLMSTGTENIVFNRLFDAGTHWDNWVKYPFYPGYCTVGTVEAVGEGVESVKVGDRVAYRAGHRSHAVINETNAYLIPESISFEEAVWFPLAKIAFMGVKVAGYHLGDSCLIIGAGPIGQMSLRWASAAGLTSIIVVDTAAHRMPLAKAGGATATITESIDTAREAILKAGGGELPRVVIDSTGNPVVFAAALGLAAKFGTVVVLGDTGQPARQTLTPDVVTRGIKIVGAHDGHATAEWTEAVITKMLFDLVVTKRFSLEGLTSHVFKPEQCAEAYETANRDRSTTMGILFDWSGEVSK